MTAAELAVWGLLTAPGMITHNPFTDLNDLIDDDWDDDGWTVIT
jgi:hypothetical protein